jgi:membrane protein DedA with SNARE-associated domain
MAARKLAWLPMLTTELLRYGYVVLFFAAAIEGDASLLTATFLAHRGYFSLPAVIATAAVATCCANQTYYWLGRRHARSALDRLRTHRLFGWLRQTLARHSLLLLFVSRFLYGFRIAIPLGCGATGMSPAVFAGIDLMGASLWSMVIGMAGWAIGHGLEVLAGDIRRHEGAIAIGLLVVTFVVLAIRGRDWRGAAAAEGLLLVHERRVSDENTGETGQSEKRDR